MEKRIFFNSDKARNLFFEEVLRMNRFDSWKDIYLNFNVPRKTLDKYRNGKLTIPETLFKKMSLNFNNTLVIYLNKNISYLDRNWGRVKGGKNTYAKHKNIFDRGRIKGMKVINELRKDGKVYFKFDLKLPLTKELAYFIGLFIGDGFTNKYGRYYLTQFTGNKIKEKSYYEKIISSIVEDLFNLSLKIKEDINTNTLRANLYSKELFLLITERFGIERGRKTRDVVIPDEILNSESEILLSCIAGIYDAEGSLYFDKRDRYKKPYPVICLHMKNISLLKQISLIFNIQNINHSVSGNYKKIYVYGKNNVAGFLRRIKLLNTKYKKDIYFLFKS